MGNRVVRAIGFSEGDFGDAEILSKAKVTSVSGLQLAGIVVSKGGKVRLLTPTSCQQIGIPERSSSNRLGNDASPSARVPPPRRRR